MANADKPRGFKVAYTKHGGPARLTRYYSDGVLPIGIGDIVDITTGVIASITAATDIPMGVAATYCACADTTTAVYVYDDLQNTIFQTQAKGAVIAAEANTQVGYEIEATAMGTANDPFSQMEMDDSATTNDSLWCIGLVERPDNTWGEFADVYVEIITDQMAHGVAHRAS